MGKRQLMSLNEMYYDIIVYFQTLHDTEYAESMLDNSRIRDRKAIKAEYERQCAEIKKRHLQHWHLAVDMNECFTFPHPEWGNDLSQMFWIKELKKSIKASRLMIADALYENVWWVNMELRGKSVNGYRVMCQTKGCMNPKHWINLDKEIAR